MTTWNNSRGYCCGIFIEQDQDGFTAHIKFSPIMPLIDSLLHVIYWNEHYRAADLVIYCKCFLTDWNGTLRLEKRCQMTQKSWFWYKFFCQLYITITMYKFLFVLVKSFFSLYIKVSFATSLNHDYVRLSQMLELPKHA